MTMHGVIPQGMAHAHEGAAAEGALLARSAGGLVGGAAPPPSRCAEGLP